MSGLSFAGEESFKRRAHSGARSKPSSFNFSSGGWVILKLNFSPGPEGRKDGSDDAWSEERGDASQVIKLAASSLSIGWLKIKRISG